MDVVDALDLLDACLRSQAAGYYSAADSEVPGALLSAALGSPPMREHGVLGLPPRCELEDSESECEPGTLTIGALIALRAADRKQRAGSSWNCSVAAARSAVVAYVDLLPVQLIQRATARTLDQHAGSACTRTATRRCTDIDERDDQRLTTTVRRGALRWPICRRD
jgi:hypothetical protein